MPNGRVLERSPPEGELLPHKEHQYELMEDEPC